MNYDLFGNEIIEQKLIDREILAEVLEKELYGITSEKLVGLMYSKFEAIIDYSRLCNGLKTGEKISMVFNHHRYSTQTKSSKSIVDAFKDKNFLSGLSRAILFKEGKVKELLYQVLQLGINGIQYVNEFSPIISRDYCLLRSAKRVLDPCAGWGGRMIGVASTGGYYHGFEPSTETYKGLVELGNFLKQFHNGFDFKIENLPFEDSIISESYDLALTSPPYYDTEIYSDEETNSCNRYKTFESWCEGFYLPMLEKAYKHSDCFIVNVGSRKYDLKKVMLDRFPTTIEINSKLSGKGGLGKTENGKEAFYIVSR